MNGCFREPDRESMQTQRTSAFRPFEQTSRSAQSRHPAANPDAAVAARFAAIRRKREIWRWANFQSGGQSEDFGGRGLFLELLFDRLLQGLLRTMQDRLTMSWQQVPKGQFQKPIVVTSCRFFPASPARSYRGGPEEPCLPE